ncbi:MAG: thioredoxin domain-containing protein [Candidatus Krumholzibacteria bacterium]|nr:thioredoxin domain-containing protein [Candidatus Krumholzibacteria bacterium]MDH4338333.1 thioredoxin domain-containing protein [Candidatus Krumholzibacteria bacterium]
MRPTRIALAVAALCVVASTAGAEVRWSNEPYAQMLERAKQENKFVFIDFYATWCGPCKRLDKEVYPQASAEKLLNSMIAAKFDAEKDPWKPVANEFRVRAYPTLLVLGPDGKEVGRYIGYLPTDEFVEVIGGYAAGKSQLEMLEAQLTKNPNDFDLLVNTGIVHADAGRDKMAMPMFEKALTLDPNDERKRQDEIYYSMGEACYGVKNYKDARTYYSRVVADFPNSEYYNDSMRRLAGTEFKLGNADAAVATYWKITEPHQDDAGALNGFAWFCAQRKIGLDQALPVALKAVELSERDPGILDTLAEVYYARGEYDDAIKIGREALASDPDDPYFKEQVEKFKKAKEEADQAMR